MSTAKKKLVKQFFKGKFSSEAFFRGAIFLRGIFLESNFLRGFFPGGIFPDIEITYKEKTLNKTLSMFTVSKRSLRCAFQ